jgi:hypothetical protein
MIYLHMIQGVERSTLIALEAVSDAAEIVSYLTPIDTPWMVKDEDLNTPVNELKLLRFELA